MSKLMENIEKVHAELQEILHKLDALYAQYPHLFQFLFVGIAEGGDNDEGKAQVSVFEGSHIHVGKQNKKLFTQIINLNLALQAEIERFKVWMINKQFHVYCSIASKEVKEGEWPEKGKEYVVVKHRIDRANHCILFNVKEKDGKLLRSNIKGYNGAFPSILFSPNETLIAQLN